MRTAFANEPALFALPHGTPLGGACRHLLRLPTFLLVAALMAGCASKPLLQESGAVKSQALSFAPPPGMACVYVVRPHQFGGDHNPPFRVKIDSNEWGLLTCEAYIFGVVPPGDHELLVQGPTEASSGANVSGHFHADAGGNYFLEAAIGWTSLKVTQLSVADGQDRVNKFKLIGWSPETAVSPGQWEVFKAQVERGSSVDCQDEKGLTPLFYAARHGNSNAVVFLLAHGADANHKSKTGETPLMWAASGPGDDWSLADDSVDSALACSASGTGDNLPVVISLVGAGADINARTKKGLTAMGLAALWGNSSITLWLYDQAAAADIPEKECEVNGRLAQILGDYFLAQDKVEEARASFERAQRYYKATVQEIKEQLAARQLTQALLGMAQLAVAAAGQHQANIQAHQMAQIEALSQASRSGGGVVAYSAYLQKYNTFYVPTYTTGYIAPPDPSDVDSKLKYYGEMERFMGRVVACFANYASLTELHGRIESLRGQSPSPYAFAIACVQETARNYAAKSGDTNVMISPMELPDHLYGQKIESEIRFGGSALWRLTIMSGWTPATQARKGYDLNQQFLRITFMDAQRQQTGEVYFRMNQIGDKMTIVYTTNLADPRPATIDGEFDLSNYESRIKDDLERIAKAQLAQLENSHPIKK
jgi:hypothetical protein